MAVVLVTTLTVKPDRFKDNLDLLRKYKALAEKHGGKNVRLLAAETACEATGAMVVIVEADDHAALGAVKDKYYADPEGMALGLSLNTAASPVAGFQNATWVDVSL